MLGLKQVAHRSDGDDLAVRQRRDAITDGVEAGKVVGDHEHRQPQRPAALCVLRSWLSPIVAPITSISPLRRGMSPIMVRIKTVLPPPEAPTRPRISPRRTSRVR